MAALDQYRKRRGVADTSDRTYCSACNRIIEPGEAIYRYSTGRLGGDPYTPRQHVVCPPRTEGER